MKVRSKSPLRLGLAGGGTDVSPYSDEFGGCVLNATINLYAYCTIETITDGIEFVASDLNKNLKANTSKLIPLSGELLLHKAVYNRVVKDFCNGKGFPVRVTTFSDAPPGSGLGSSSTMVVAMLKAYQQFLNLPLGEYDLAHLAYEIERVDCKLSGGKQDQYATAFGGFNFMEFLHDDKVIVNPLRIRSHIINELESQMLLYFTGISRDSAKIIDDQIKSTSGSENDALLSMHEVKALSFKMKESLLKSDIPSVSAIINDAWLAKKKTSMSISNPILDEICDQAFKSGAISLKVSGAGGGGFMMIFVNPEDRLSLIESFSRFDGYFSKFNFTNEGSESWLVT